MEINTRFWEEYNLENWRERYNQLFFVFGIITGTHVIIFGAMNMYILMVFNIFFMTGSLLCHLSLKKYRKKEREMKNDNR